MMNNPPVTSSPTTLSEAFVQQLACGLRLGSPPVALPSDSPPESMLSLALHLLLRRELEADRLRIHPREPLVLAGRTALQVEVDLLIHQPATGARAIVEIASWTWHRRSRAEFAREIRRERRLRRAYPMEVYGAREVSDDPWGVALEIVGLLGTVWSAFAPVEIPEDIRVWAEGRPQQRRKQPGCDKGANELVPAPAALSLLERIRTRVAHLPRSDASDDPGLKLLRRDFPRSHEMWDSEEERLVVQAYRSRLDITAVARAVQRTPSAVWRRLRKTGVVP